MADTTTVVHVPVDRDVNAQATETLAAMGLTVSDAVHIFLKQVVSEKKMPFTLNPPNASSRAAITEAIEMIKRGESRFASADALIDDIEKAGRK